MRQAFELYARGDKRLDEIADFLFAHGIHTKKSMVCGKKTTGNKPYSRTRMARMLANPFYYGHFRYLGEIHEGKYKGIISKQLFDRVQTVLERCGKPTRKTNDPLPLCGLVYYSCSMMFTAETRIKRQKNGNVHVYVYYRCTHKSKAVVCREPHIRAEELDKQLSALLLRYAMPASWADKLCELIDKDEKIAGRRCALPAKKPPVRATVFVLVPIWCARRESNPHGLFIQGILSPSRLPIPPLAHGVFIKMEAPTGIEPVYAVLQTAA